MEITEFTIKCLILGLPGIIAYNLSEKLIVRKQQDVTSYISTVLLYSIISYILTSVHFALFTSHDINYVYDIICISHFDHNELQIMIFGCIYSILVAWIIGFCYRFNLINRIAIYFGATKRFGDVDVWHYFNDSNMDEKNDGYVYVRDLKANLTYYGYIALYSDSGMERELLLSNVSVYSNSDSQGNSVLYEVAHLYLARNRDDLSIEVPMPLISNEKDNSLNVNREEGQSNSSS